MRFIVLVKNRTKITEEIVAQNLKLMQQDAEEDGVKTIDVYWTLGRYDAVVIVEAPNEKAVMKITMRRAEWMASETMVAVPAEEARKLVE